jgi:formylglycine-generating enzyme required for sulfatase activity
MSASVAIGRSRRAGMMLNSLGMTFAHIPDGRYMMGSESDADHTFVGDELPQHPVRITRAFFLSVFPVTQVEFRTVMGRNPSYFSEARKGTPSHPVESVTWFEAQEFCATLSSLPDEVAAGRRYVLPTEAEWEYACRAGTRTPFWCGDKLSPTAANFAHGSEKNRTIPSASSTLPVGQFRPNLWGLYDMHGNVAEWVSDWYSDRYYAESPIDDPAGPASGSAKVTRGGCWQSLWSECRSAARAAFPPERGTNRIGFRVVMLEQEG